MNVVEENKSRLLRFKGEYNQITGAGSVIPRREVYIEEFGVINLPEEMFTYEWVSLIVGIGSIEGFVTMHLKKEDYNAVYVYFLRTRLLCDFEFFCASCARIKDKSTGQDVPFLLNHGQRKLLRLMESQRLSGEPIRIILLKARQWGGSTLTQIYMAWFQLFRKTGWHSVIAAHLSSSSANIKGMYSKLLENLPGWCSDNKLDFQPFERMQSTSIIKSRNNKVTIGSAESPNSIRGMDITMAHLSEVAFWADTPRKKATDLIRSITSPILPQADSIIVMESTANGVGDYFHTEYINSKQGNTDKKALFVAWFEIEQYSLPMKEEEYQTFYDTLSDYELFLWNSGATLESIKWYRTKRKEYQNDSDMMAEYPTNDIEAFALSGERAFQAELINKLRKNCTPPLKVGEITSTTSKKQSGKESLQDISFVEHHRGRLSLWADREEAEIKNRYIVVVDVGGRSKKSDYSVICVIDRYWLMYGGVPEVVAQWRGHIDHDLLAWKAAHIAKYYNNALLVIESNTLETDSDGEHTEYILDQIAEEYPNLYARIPSDKIKESAPVRWGFHTNRSTKTMIIDNMVSILREDQYIERDHEACNEFDLYEKKDNGSYGAIEGHHDDILMTRLIGMYIAYTEDLPKEVTNKIARHKKIVSEATI